MSKRLCILLALILALVAIPVSAEVTPNDVNLNLAPGESDVIDKQVQTSEIPENPDIVFLSDTTGSMGGAIANVKANAANILSTIATNQPTAQFAVAEYRDVGDAFVWRVNQNVTANQTAVQNAINGWNAAGGGDFPEAQLIALKGIADGAVSFRPGSTRIIVWFGDAPGHENFGPYPTRNAVADALNTADIQVLAISVGINRLNDTGQAAFIASQTGGSFFSGATAAQLSNTILEGLGNLPVTVTPHTVGCDLLDVSFAPASQTVTSGDIASFTETVAVPNDPSLAGSTINCSVEFRDNAGNVIGTQNITVDVPIALDAAPDTATNELGDPGQTHTVVATVTSGATLVPDREVTFEVTAGPNTGENGSDTTDASGEASFTYEATQGPSGLGTDTIRVCLTGTELCEEVTKVWEDTTPPIASCEDGVNPSGRNVPQAGQNSPGQNEDGFYQLGASDDVWPAEDLEIFVVDNGSGVEFGPYSVGDVIKYTQAPGAEPNEKSGPGAVTARITGKGDAEIYAVDGSGNVSERVSCLVPPKPQ